MTSYYTPQGGLPPQTQLMTGRAVFTNSYAFIPRGAANFKIFADVIKNVPTECFEMETPDGRGALNYAVRGPVQQVTFGDGSTGLSSVGAIAYAASPFIKLRMCVFPIVPWRRRRRIADRKSVV